VHEPAFSKAERMTNTAKIFETFVTLNGMYAVKRHSPFPIPEDALFEARASTRVF
jgi:hypothetical protein